MTFPHHHEGCPLDELRASSGAHGVHKGTTKDNHDRVALRRPLVGSTGLEASDLLTLDGLGETRAAR